MADKQPRIKLNPITKDCLEMLKTEKNWSFDRVIDALLIEHDELNDPEIIKEKEKKLCDNYVEISEYNRLYNENIGNREKVKKLTGKLEDTIKETIKEKKDQKEQFTAKLKEQHALYDKLRNELILKENKIKVLTTENRDINQKLDQLNFILSDIQKKYEKYESDYSRFCNYIDSVYLLTDQKLETLTYVIFFLSELMNRKHVFTLNQLTDKLIHCRADEIKEITPLFKYKIFPVNKYLVDGVECFGFDRHYLKR